MDTDHGAFAAGCLVLATGGMSIPKMGATGFGLRSCSEVRASGDGDPAGSGAADVRRGSAGADAALERGVAGYCCLGGSDGVSEATLFTHRGLSGPAVLQISSYWQQGPISVNLLPGGMPGGSCWSANDLGRRRNWRAVLGEVLPARLASALAATVQTERRGWPMCPIGCWRQWRSGYPGGLCPSGTEGFAKAEVTRGGVDTRDLSSRTMAANAVPGLFVIGEAVDVTGWLGGYNFQWAWASGWCAGEAV